MGNKFFVLVLFFIILGCLSCTVQPASPSQPGSSPSVTLAAAEVEAVEFMGQKLTPLDRQRNNALSGTPDIERDSYRLSVDGLVETTLSLTYADLLALPQISKLMELDCVEGWDFTAKWTGPTLKSIFEKAGLKTNAQNVIFHTSDVPEGYSSLLLSYVLEKDIILGLKINDLTLPPEKGFPMQVVAESKYGYKWAKWVTRIELSDNLDFRGYWESAGYNNSADVNGPAFEKR